MKKALITGITGQDASYLAELLLEKGYEVHGTSRRVALEDPSNHFCRIKHILNDIKLHSMTLESYSSIYKVINEVKPDLCFHLAAQSFVSGSFEDEFSTMNININGTGYVFSALRDCARDCKTYFAGSSEMFGKVHEVPQKETTPFHPRSVYGVSKVSGYYLAQHYREAYNMFICSGILFNHCSPNRGLEFVTRKITNAVAKIKLGKLDKLKLGNIEAKRDWGYAGDYVNAMYLMLQQEKPEDFVIATGKTYSIKEFLEIAFSYVGLDWKEYVEIDKNLYRPSEVDLLVGDATKAKCILGWESTVTLEELIKLMIDEDLKQEQGG